MPKVVYGYFPCHAEGNYLVVLDPVHRKEQVARLALPRQPGDQHLCMADWFREERGSDVSPYKLAETWDRMAWAHWEKGERERAREILREALAKYGETVRGDVLRRSQSAFERPGRPAGPPHRP